MWAELSTTNSSLLAAPPAKLETSKMLSTAFCEVSVFGLACENFCFDTNFRIIDTTDLVPWLSGYLTRGEFRLSFDTCEKFEGKLSTDARPILLESAPLATSG